MQENRARILYDEGYGLDLKKRPTKVTTKALEYDKVKFAVVNDMHEHDSVMQVLFKDAKDKYDILSRLSLGEGNALSSFTELKRLMDSLDRNGNPLYRIFCNIFFLNDFFLIRRFSKWESCYLSRMNEWIESVSKFDALVSMATFRYNEP